VGGVWGIKERIFKFALSVTRVRSPLDFCLERQAENDSGWIMSCASSGDEATSPIAPCGVEYPESGWRMCLKGCEGNVCWNQLD
jgi:hypothetical protein